MNKLNILVINAGDGAGISFIRSLKLTGKYRIFGLDTNKEDYLTSESKIKFLCKAGNRDFLVDEINKIVEANSIDLVYVADTGAELDTVFERRHQINAKTFLPNVKDEICEDKWLTYKRFKNAEIIVPETALAVDETGVHEFIAKHKDVWLRKKRGSGGAGSISTNDANFACEWINRHNGWGEFTIADKLGTKNLTWTALWYDGALQMSQLRERILWKYRHLAPSGVTGITGIQRTVWDPELHQQAIRIVEAIVRSPHGVVSVDFTYDKYGNACPTEIQTSRFFTSIDFLANLGVNFPDHYCRLACGEPPTKNPKINPIRDTYYWIRAVDRLPTIMTASEYDACDADLRRA